VAAGGCCLLLVENSHNILLPALIMPAKQESPLFSIIKLDGFQEIWNLAFIGCILYHAILDFVDGVLDLQ